MASLRGSSSSMAGSPAPSLRPTKAIGLLYKSTTFMNIPSATHWHGQYQSGSNFMDGTVRNPSESSEYIIYLKFQLATIEHLLLSRLICHDVSIQALGS